MTGTRDIKTEICIDSVEGALAAEAAGADRVELCSALLEGGLTPSYGMVKQAVLAAKKVEIQVMIRPRGGDFLYSDQEFMTMREDIHALKPLGVSGFVFGILDADGQIDEVRVQQLVDLARPAQVTFHRAIDMAKDPFSVLNVLINMGVDRVLTSGQAPNALEGAPLIKRLIDHAAGRIVIMPGSGVTSNTIQRIIEQTGARDMHFSAFEKQPSSMQFRAQNIFMGSTLRSSEFERKVTAASVVKKVLDRID